MRKPSEPEISVETAFDAIKVRFGDVLHLHIIRSEFLGMQSWLYREGKKYCIEFTMKGGVVLCEYDSRDKFETILAALDKVL